MQDFNNKQQTVSKIIKLLGSNYEFYCISFYSYSLNLQGAYSSNVVYTIRREFKVEPTFNKAGFVEFYFKLNDESINITLT